MANPDHTAVSPGRNKILHRWGIRIWDSPGWVWIRKNPGCFENTTHQKYSNEIENHVKTRTEKSWSKRQSSSFGEYNRLTKAFKGNQIRRWKIMTNVIYRETTGFIPSSFLLSTTRVLHCYAYTLTPI